MVDADSFIVVKEFEKYGHDLRSSNEFQKDIDTIVLHEVGHMFQLDHMFDGRPSIMSYDDTEAVIYQYDIEAIQALYPPLVEDSPVLRDSDNSILIE